jgi:hypothetical protein
LEVDIVNDEESLDICEESNVSNGIEAAISED